MSSPSVNSGGDAWGLDAFPTPPTGVGASHNKHTNGNRPTNSSNMNHPNYSAAGTQQQPLYNGNNGSSNGGNGNNSAPGAGGGKAPRPSDARRAALNAELAQSIPMVSNFFPLERYYDAACKVHASFQAALSQKQLDDAYVYGKRYCMFCIDAIPNHNYYGKAQYKAQQILHTKQMEKVIQQLEQVATLMDQEEILLEQRRQEEAKRRAHEQALREQAQYQELIQRAARQREQQRVSSSSTATLQPESLEAKLQRLARPSTTSSTLTTDDLYWKPQEDIAAAAAAARGQDPSGEEPRGTPGSRYRLTDEDEDDEDFLPQNAVPVQGPLPPPLLPPSSTSLPASSSALPLPPPSYDQVLKQQTHRRHLLGPTTMPSSPQDDDDDYDDNKSSSKQAAPFLDSSKFNLEESTRATTEKPKKVKKKIVPVRLLKEQCKQEYVRYQQTGQIKIWGLDTYQGRVTSSTNGCTVISALTAASHLSSQMPQLQDNRICYIIDTMAGPVLRNIRSKVGLSGCALIIPSDVHDYLTDAGILKQDWFVGAAGGNILDLAHLNSFIDLICSNTNDNKKTTTKSAATLFFHEHVVSILKTPKQQSSSSSLRTIDSDAYEYDLVDSLPGMTGTGGRPMATRTRCYSRAALTSLLLWYASRRMTDSNCSYIDNNTTWDDATADLDPRVFQGFVWAV